MTKPTHPLWPLPILAALVLCAAAAPLLANGDASTFGPRDVFELEYASDPQIAPDGSRIVYARTSLDIMTDRPNSDLWTINWDGTGHRPLISGKASFRSPRWSPSGDRLAYVSSDEDGRSQIFVRYSDTGQVAKLTHLERGPGGLSWSPDGQWIAFSMFVPEQPKPFAKMPAKPQGATWAPPARVYDTMFYRSDGGGFSQPGFRQLFVLTAEGGTPRQLTTGKFNHGGTPSWSADGKTLYFSGNLRDEWEDDPSNSEVYALDLASGDLKALTSRHGPDRSPIVSPDGKHIAFGGYDQKYLGHQNSVLQVMDADGKNVRTLGAEIDRSLGGQRWSSDGKSLYFTYSTEGNGKLARISLDGEVGILADNFGGLSLGRPYGGGQYSVSKNDRFAFTVTNPSHPADLAVVEQGKEPRRLTRLNDDLFGHKELGAVEEIWWKSSHDGLDVQGWIAKPPGFDPSKKYPLILEIHGGPFSDYGDRFAAEIQLYASAGYVVLYTNPRGSTSYGEDFANEIHHAYPSNDYDDLMSGVDEVIAQGYVDEKQLFVTGGSGGGVLTSWIVGHTERFAGAAVQKPVINWYSWVLTADIPTAHMTWFPGLPWDNLEHYMQRSPISYVKNVTTPTMLITGEADYRTPMSESEQYYQALQLVGVETALVRIPEASHGIAARPSHLISKVQHILAWFERYRTSGDV
ncbi:MAG: S9 family peptidase [Acidobacteriota bacterium]